MSVVYGFLTLYHSKRSSWRMHKCLFKRSTSRYRLSQEQHDMPLQNKHVNKTHVAPHVCAWQAMCSVTANHLLGIGSVYVCREVSNSVRPGHAAPHNQACCTVSTMTFDLVWACVILWNACGTSEHMEALPLSLLMTLSDSHRVSSNSIPSPHMHPRAELELFHLLTNKPCTKKEYIIIIHNI